MALPRWLAQLNKRTFNRLELRKGKRPVITHVGRRSGREYQTPLDAHPVDGGFVFILNYGSGSDWVKNILAGGAARLDAAGKTYQLANPRILTKEEAVPLLAPGTKTPPGAMNVTEFLLMDVVSGSAAA